ncbi:MASE3 domain-containing protein [Oceanispirochaeta sp.]|uniref:MASE3 domain-containing protein n=1 Tax=Oceanispirochaeta sp. TaxID=2035350 RepID=UPI00262E490D|nr:MASE3 domain-containing protein [Oceanispirochaeta sp.]MDA3956567.1 diguanylate cyclase [Oceanispirochaeta sp.]
MLGLGYLAVAILDLLHTLTYQGMNLFESDIFYANQLWICARIFESITIFLFLIYSKRVSIGFYKIASLYLLAFITVLLTIFYFKIFPACFILGKGQTEFKIISEYIICIILGVSLYMLRTKYFLDNEVINTYLSFSIIITILSELSFTLYMDNYGLLNVMGHFLKLISFYFIYKSILLVNVRNPLVIIFEELRKKEDRILLLLSELEKEKNIAIESSITDGLTGISNRRYFDQALIEKYYRAQRQKQSLSIIMIDIDFFKLYNDQYGHVSGDECLIRVAKALQDVMSRATDILARYGGEEFVVLLEDTNEHGAGNLANKMRKSIIELEIEHSKSEISKYVTISLGVHTIHNFEIEEINQVVGFADEALYKAKSNGRNRVEF